MYGISETISTKARMDQSIYFKNVNWVVQSMKSTIRALQLFFQKHVILSIHITKKIFSKWNLANNETESSKSNWQGKNLWAVYSRSRSHSQELKISGRGLLPVRWILRKTLTKTTACEQTTNINWLIEIITMFEFYNSSTAANFELVHHPWLNFNNRCQSRFS